MDEEIKKKKIDELLDKIAFILYKDERDANKDSEEIAKLVKEAKENGLI